MVVNDDFGLTASLGVTVTNGHPLYIVMAQKITQVALALAAKADASHYNSFAGRDRAAAGKDR